VRSRNLLTIGLFSAVLALIFAPTSASASLIGDSATVELFTGGGSQGSLTATVDSSGTPEFRYFRSPDNSLSVDIESSTIQIDLGDGFTGVYVIGNSQNPIKIQITDLDWVGMPGTIVGASIVGGPSAFGETVQVTGPHAVEVVVNANSINVISGIFLSILVQLQTDHSGDGVIGGEIIPIETTSLILAGAQSFSWMIPVVLSVLGIGLFVVSRKSE